MIVEDIGVDSIQDLAYLHVNDLLDVGVKEPLARMLLAAAAAAATAAAVNSNFGEIAEITETQWQQKKLLCEFLPSYCAAVFRAAAAGDRCSELTTSTKTTKDTAKLVALAIAAFNRGQAKSSLAEWTDAVEEYHFALEAQPLYGAAWAQLGISLYHLGKFEKAVESLERGVHLLLPNTLVRTDAEHHLALAVGKFTAEKFVAMNEISRLQNRYILFEQSLDAAYAFAMAAAATTNTGAMFLEFGVFRGDSTSYIATHMRKNTNIVLDAFDSFQGLPEEWEMKSNHPLLGYAKQGTFRVANNGASVVQRLRKEHTNLRLHVGIFEETLDEFLKNRKDSVIAFVHIDCDLGSSTTYVLKTLRPYLRVGTILQFDELIGWPGWKEEGGEYFALQQFLAETNLRVIFLGSAGQAVSCMLVSS